MDRLAIGLATGFGAGYGPKAPGTFGTLVGLPFVWIIHSMDLSITSKMLCLIATCIIGYWSIFRVEQIWQRHDDPRIVIDEIAGIVFTLVWFDHSYLTYTLGFLFFRLFDIWKPGPIGYVDEHWPGAAGTFFDDIIAGLAAAGCIGLIQFIAF